MARRAGSSRELWLILPREGSSSDQGRALRETRSPGRQRAASVQMRLRMLQVRTMAEVALMGDAEAVCGEMSTRWTLQRWSG